METKVIVYSPRKLTPTERRILAYVSDHEGKPFTKGELANALGRSRGTIDRSITRLRADGLIACEPTYDEHGAQLANVYRIASRSIPLSPQKL